MACVTAHMSYQECILWTSPGNTKWINGLALFSQTLTRLVLAPFPHRDLIERDDFQRFHQPLGQAQVCQ